MVVDGTLVRTIYHRDGEDGTWATKVDKEELVSDEERESVLEKEFGVRRLAN